MQGAGASLALAGVLTATAVEAQIVPQADHQAHGAQTPPAASGVQQEPEVVFISDYIAACRPDAAPGTEEYQQQLDDCAWPSAATESDFRSDSRPMTREQFFARWPNAGITGWNRALEATSDLCEMARETWDLLQAADVELANANLQLADLEAIHAQLPDEIRGATRIMTISQAMATGALCVLSAGLYCVAVFASFVGNFFTGRMSQRLQLVHVRLAVINIAITRANIVLQRIHIRLTTMWMDHAIPACFRRDAGVGWTMPGLANQSPPLAARW